VKGDGQAGKFLLQVFERSVRGVTVHNDDLAGEMQPGTHGCEMLGQHVPAIQRGQKYTQLGHELFAGG
jgi:hypothetical protein